MAPRAGQRTILARGLADALDNGKPGTSYAEASGSERREIEKTLADVAWMLAGGSADDAAQLLSATLEKRFPESCSGAAEDSARQSKHWLGRLGAAFVGATAAAAEARKRQDDHAADIAACQHAVKCALVQVAQAEPIPGMRNNSGRGTLCECGFVGLGQDLYERALSGEECGDPGRKGFDSPRKQMVRDVWLSDDNSQPAAACSHGRTVEPGTRVLTRPAHHVARQCVTTGICRDETTAHKYRPPSVLEPSCVTDYCELCDKAWAMACRGTRYCGAMDCRYKKGLPLAVEAWHAAEQQKPFLREADKVALRSFMTAKRECDHHVETNEVQKSGFKCDRIESCARPPFPPPPLQHNPRSVG